MLRLPIYPLLAVLALVTPACGASGGSDADVAPDAEVLPDTPDTDADVADDVPPDAPGDVAPEPDADLPDLAPADEVGPDDTGAEAVEPAPDPVWGYAGSIHVVQTMAYGGGAVPQSSALEILLMDAPYGRNHVLEAEEGACRFYRVAEIAPCDPPCADDWTEYCTIDGQCLPFPQRVSAGTITVSGVKGGPYPIPVGEADWYSAPATPASLFDAGAAITVSATGGDIPAFEAHVTGVGPLKAPIDGVLTLVDGAPQVVTWTKANDGSTVELILQIGWHGAPPTAILWCTAPDADGQVTIPQAMVEAFPTFGGMGLFQHPAYLRRVSRAVAASPGGPIEILVTSQMGFGVVH